MNQETRMFVALGASLLIFYVWYTWVDPTPVPTATQEQVVAADSAGTEVVAQAEPAAAAVAKAPQAQPKIPAEEVTIDTGVASITLSNEGGLPTAWSLRDYLAETDGKTGRIDLVTAPPLALHMEGFGAEFPEAPRYRVEKRSDTQVDFVWDGSAVQVRKSFEFQPDSYAAKVSVQVSNKTRRAIQGKIGLAWAAENKNANAGGFMDMLNPPSDIWMPIYLQDASVERIDDPEDLQNVVQENGSFDWVGLESRYFLGAILPRESSRYQLQASLQGQSLNEGLVNAALWSGTTTVPAGSTVQKDYTVFVGPKEIDALKAVHPTLESAIDYGLVGVIAVPTLYLLKFFYNLIHNYGIAIILLTLVIKALLHPITKKSMESMRRMQQLQPQMKELREKHKDDREKLNAEMMQLFKAQKVNPMGGCLPMLLQLPIYFALYRVLWNSVELYRAPFFGYLTDLSAPDPLYITPIILGIAFFMQQQLTPNPSADPAQKKMMNFMSIMFTGFMLFLPSGLVIYILVNTVFTVLQQWLMNRGRGFRDLFKGDISPRPT